MRRGLCCSSRANLVAAGEKLCEGLTTTERRGRREIEQSQIGPEGEEAGATESKDTENTEGDFMKSNLRILWGLREVFLDLGAEGAAVGAARGLGVH